MIPHDQPLRKEMIEKMLNTFTDESLEIMTKWESDFILSIRDQFDKKNDLSDRQCEILERLYDEI